MLDFFTSFRRHRTNFLAATDSIRPWFVVAIFFSSALLTAFGLVGGKSCLAAARSAKSAGDGDTADDDDSNVDLQLSALVVPARFSLKNKETDMLKFLVEVRGLLLEGFRNKGDSAEAARKHYEAAYKLPVIDPRACYAYGVVLLGQNKSAIAIEQFRVAARGRKVPYLPALQALAWTHLSRGDHAQALPALLDLAKRLEDAQESWPAAEDKENSAEWLGRTIGFLTGPGKVAAQASQIDKLAGDVGNVLSAERKQAYDRGRKAAAARHDELQTQAARPEAELVAEAGKKRDEIVTAAEVARREAKLIEGELATLKKAHDKQLAELATEIHDNAMKVKTTRPRIPAAEAEIEDLSAPKKHASVKMQGSNTRRSVQTTRKVIRDENAGEKKIRESQLASAQKKLQHIKSSLEDAEKAVTDAKQQRDDEQVTFRKETAPRRQALQASQQKAAELAARAREAEKGPQTAEQLKARVTSLEAYVPFYLELERDRLLASLKPSSQ